MERLFALLLLSFLFCACNEDSTIDIPSQTDSTNRTVLVYMAAQNSLGKHGNHRTDSAEIMSGREFMNTGQELLMLIDDDMPPRLYRVNNQTIKPQLLKRWSEDPSSTDPHFMSEVLSLTRQYAPAEEYGLVLWSHADGWIPSCPDDDLAGDWEQYGLHLKPFSFGVDSGPNGHMSDKGEQMEVGELAQAMNEVGFHSKYVFFDACLMQNIEVAYALRRVTDYVVASPIATPAAGAYYKHLLRNGLFSNNPTDIARTYLEDVRRPELEGDYSDFGLCISCIQTDRLEYLAQVLRQALPYSTLANGNSPKMQFTQEVDGKPETVNVLNYQAYSIFYSYRPHNYDALQALRCVLPSDRYAEIKLALDNVVTYYGATSKFWIGPSAFIFQSVPTQTGDYRAVSMFIPQDVYSQHVFDTTCGDLNVCFRKTEWYRDAGFNAIGW